MALADITLNDGAASPVAHTFAYVGTDPQGRVLRRDMSQSPETPLELAVGHREITEKGVKKDERSLRFTIHVADTDGVVYPVPGTVTFRVPRAVASDTLSKNFFAYIRNACTEARALVFFKGGVD